MELLSKNNNIQHSPKANQNNDVENPSDRMLLAGILESLPGWETTKKEPQLQDAASTVNHDFLFSNMFGSLDAATTDIIGAIGSGIRNQKMSPGSNSSINCGWCDINASIRCLDCNEFMCMECLHDHRKSPFSSNHSVISLPAPIGTSPTHSYQCDLHNEVLRYVCEYCKILVCQCCTFREHKDHNYTSIQNFADESPNKINAALESSNMGTKCIKGSIDKALAFIRMVERNCAELSDSIRKAFRQFIIAIEDREKFLLDFVEKLRNRKLANLHDQMAGLKSALSGLAETSDMLSKVSDNCNRMDKIDVAMKITKGQRQLEQFAAVYKDLQPKQETFGFVPPDYGILHDLRTQGGVVLAEDKGLNPENLAVANSNVPGVISIPGRRPILRDNTLPMIAPSVVRNHNGGSSVGGGVGGGGGVGSGGGLDWELSVLRSTPATFNFGSPRITQCIPGSSEHVKIQNSNALSASFGLEGHEDGQVSRPWGVCVDKSGNVLVSDRRNNRIQVFSADGILKFKFGRKGVGNGEFDLPAGICVDVDNRIIVVDKDNHRVQIFSSTGAFLLKFGSYGKEYGQFQYPWDVAVNSRRQIVVTDSRNHRIQQFDSEGRFIRQIVFDNHGQNKGIASPRGVCYTPQGNIIVSDFDNHCLYLIDPDVNEILAAKGHEGSSFQEFNRPSGICCDDDGRIIVADSKNQRIVVFSPNLEYLWDVEIRPSQNPLMPGTLDEKDRSCDVALMPDGRLVFLIELSPDAKEGSNPHKRFIHIF